MDETSKEMRQTVRRKVKPIVDVNQGVPNRGGHLRDISTTGAAIYYPPDRKAVDQPLELDEIVFLNVGKTALPGRIVRMFENGFAVKFDWAIDFVNSARSG